MQRAAMLAGACFLVTVEGLVERRQVIDDADEINFHAVIELADEHGELAKRQGYFKARIEGERLEPVMRHVRLGRRVTIHKNRKAADTAI